MKRVSPRLFAAVSALACGFVAVVACTDDAPPPIAPGPDGSTFGFDAGPSTAADGSTQPGDLDAGETTDGGENPFEEDGGTTDLDGGFDAGPACAVVEGGKYSTTTCSVLTARMNGGDLTKATGTYQLQSVAIAGSPDFCKAGYIPFDFRGGLEVSATSPTAATLEFFEQHRRSGGGPIIRPSTVRYDVTVAATDADLAFTPQACALTKPPAGGQYALGTTPENKKTFILRLPQGRTGAAIFRFVEP